MDPLEDNFVNSHMWTISASVFKLIHANHNAHIKQLNAENSINCNRKLQIWYQIWIWIHSSKVSSGWKCRFYKLLTIIQPDCKWFMDQIHKMKRKRRNAKHIWKTSKLDVDKQKYLLLQDETDKVIIKIKKDCVQTWGKQQGNFQYSLRTYQTLSILEISHVKWRSK